jgi:protein tyrosine phosphatase (PTP) superfamily phosphohydrolase (DUF442 family)
MRCSRRAALLMPLAVLAPGRTALAATPEPGRFDAPNLVEISPRLVTSGQPNAATLASLAAHGFAADIYLAPLTVHDAVRDEPEIVRRQGLTFIHIPIEFNEPGERDFERFAEAMASLRERKVLVHCQVNMRASAMVFLHRVIVDREDPERAYEAVAKVWSPNGQWRRFIVAMLRKHEIAFDPY